MTINEISELVASNPGLHKHLKKQTLIDLFEFEAKRYIDTVHNCNKVDQITYLYTLSKKYEITEATKKLSLLLDVSSTTISQRLTMARNTGRLNKTRVIKSRHITEKIEIIGYNKNKGN